jgi:prophage regulatory protein
MTISNSTEATPTPGALILERLPQVKARTGLGRSEIYRRIAAGNFPSPIKLGERASAWNAAEVDSWIISRIALRDAGAGK